MEQIKDAFQKVKQDIGSIKEETDILKKGLIEAREKIIEMCALILQLNEKIDFLNEEKNKLQPIQQRVLSKETDYINNSTIKHENSTTPTDIPAHDYAFKPLNNQNLTISIGNEGVPTDRQTDRQTDRHMNESSYNQTNPIKNSIEDASKILDSLDAIKKEIRLKFKRLTEQEFLVFSMIYQLEEDTGYTDYKVLSDKLKLTESSIRDYIGRLIKKGIPIDKKRINNKNIQLNISKNLKKIATLSTILQLRGL